MRVVKHWHRLPREVGEALCLEGQAGRGSEQPDLVEDSSARCRGVGLGDL